MKEFFRKQLVSLKRNPQKIAMFFLVVCCIVFTFQLSTHSNAILFVSSKLIALTTFLVTLCSFMAIIAFVGVKKLNKKSIVPIIIVVAMLVLQIVLDVYYLNTIHYERFISANPIPDKDFVLSSISGITVHIVFLVISIVVIALLPLIAKLLAKVDTRPKGEKLQLMEDLGSAPIELESEEGNEQKAAAVQK